MKLECSRQIFENYSNIKIHASPFSGSPEVAFGQADGQTDTKELVVAFCNLANPPKSKICKRKPFLPKAVPQYIMCQ